MQTDPFGGKRIAYASTSTYICTPLNYYYTTLVSTHSTIPPLGDVCQDATRFEKCAPLCGARTFIPISCLAICAKNLIESLPSMDGARASVSYQCGMELAVWLSFAIMLCSDGRLLLVRGMYMMIASKRDDA